MRKTTKWITKHLPGIITYKVAIDASRRCEAVDVLVHMAVGPRTENGFWKPKSTEHQLRRFAGDGASEER